MGYDDILSKNVMRVWIKKKYLIVDAMEVEVDETVQLARIPRWPPGRVEYELTELLSALRLNGIYDQIFLRDQT